MRLYCLMCRASLVLYCDKVSIDTNSTLAVLLIIAHTLARTGELV